jgi:uncharacterized protein (DUF2126 family)
MENGDAKPGLHRFDMGEKAVATKREIRGCEGQAKRPGGINVEGFPVKSDKAMGRKIAKRLRPSMGLQIG